MDSVDPQVVSGTINGRLDRQPMTRHMWRLLLLIAAGRLFEQYDIYFTGYIAPGLVQSKLLTSTTASLPAIVLFGSLLFPIAEGLGVHPVHYAMIAILGMGIGLFAPLFRVGYYTARDQPDCA
jgi:putative MFS transporter